MSAFVTFSWKALWRSWRYLVEFRDHMGLALLVVALVLSVVGGSVAFAIRQRPWVSVIIGGGVLAIFWLGAFGEYDEVVTRLGEITIGAPLAIAHADRDERGGTVFTQLIIGNENDEAIPDCYVAVKDCTADNPPDPAYRGPPDGFHFNWSTYGPATNTEKTLTSIPAKSDATLDVAVSSRDAAKCHFSVWNEQKHTLEPHFSMVKGRHLFRVEVGSTSAAIQPAHYRFVLNFQGSLNLQIEDVQRI